jgi:hypothetical protein
MKPKGSVRHQILLPEQKAVFDYWRQKCLAGVLPSHREIDPCFLSPYLPTISLTEICQKTVEPRYKMRLAGTGFYNLYEDEITGRYLDEIQTGDQKTYWERIYKVMAKEQRPRVGVTNPGTPSGSHMLQFWLRLPLSCDGKNTTMILGFDKFMKREQLKGEFVFKEEKHIKTIA